MILFPLLQKSVVRLFIPKNTFNFWWNVSVFQLAVCLRVSSLQLNAIFFASFNWIANEPSACFHWMMWLFEYLMKFKIRSCVQDTIHFRKINTHHFDDLQLMWSYKLRRKSRINPAHGTIPYYIPSYRNCDTTLLQHIEWKQTLFFILKAMQLQAKNNI